MLAAALGIAAATWAGVAPWSTRGEIRRAMGEGEDGLLYLATVSDGELYRIDHPR